MFSEVQRGKFIMSLSTGKFEVCVCVHLKVNILVQLSQLVTEWLEGVLIS